jgi:dTMP kinase
MFVSFEGVDGAGKSTQAAMLAAALGEDTVLVREPGGTPAGERIRELLKDPELELAPRAELLLFLAARAELVETVIKPALAAGRDVVCDRFMDSTVAYQGAARGLGEDMVRELNAIAVDGCVPDRTVLLTLGGEVAAARGAERGGWGSDRFEREGDSFHERIAAAFGALAAAEPERILTVDGSGGTEEVHAAVLAALGAERRGAAG